jgi:hypothetical protein
MSIAHEPRTHDIHHNAFQINFNAEQPVGEQLRVPKRRVVSHGVNDPYLNRAIQLEIGHGERKEMRHAG